MEKGKLINLLINDSLNKINIYKIYLNVLIKQ